MQDERPVAYYSKKLNSAQMSYATIDKILICVAATLHAFCSMLFGAELHIFTQTIELFLMLAIHLNVLSA